MIQRTLVPLGLRRALGCGLVVIACGLATSSASAQLGDPHAAGENPHGLSTEPPPRDLSTADPTIPPGEVRVFVVGERRQPVPGAEVILTAHFQSVAEGNSESEKRAKADQDGVAVFRGLDTTLRYSYGVTVIREGAVYALPQFRLDKAGQKVVVHTYPVTNDPKAAFVGLQGFVTVRVKEDLFRVDAVYRVVNMSRMTYRPAPILVRLPDDVQGVEAEIADGDSGFREAKGGIELVGTFPPGQKDVALAFHVPNRNEETVLLEMGVPPHVVDMNVLTEMSPGLGMSVSPGFVPTEERTGRDEKKVLLTRRVLQPGEGGIDAVRIELSGLPVIGPGRWWAVVGALAIAGLGVGASIGHKKEKEKEQERDRERARRTLLEEMRLLEHARDEGVIGPRTFEQTRREILYALARLEPAAAN